MRGFLLTLTLMFSTLAHSSALATSCFACHPQETTQWQQSQHARAMLPADASSVLGDFSQVFNSDELRAEFRHDREHYSVRLTEGDVTREWSVRYTFGVYPLQQYLIDLGDGRLQALNIAWDSRPAGRGGQRWFRLDEPEHQPPGHPLHWQGIYQNWNSMCADCHSTAVDKGYSAQSDRYTTTYAQVNVGCSACHAQAEAHADAAQSGGHLPAGSDLSTHGAWLTGTQSHLPRHAGERSSEAQIKTCGLCHSLRTRLDPTPGGQMHDTLSLNRLFEPLYFADGRVRDEVFVLGSFMQSPMYQAGVVCSNCHNPHTGKLKLAGNALCSQCHASASFDSTEHHQHEEGSTGAQCVSCHMPQTTYMQVDARREHSFTTPNPRTAAKAGSPDPCLACHATKSRLWSIEQMDLLWPNHRERSEWYEAQTGDLPTMRRFLDGNPPAIQRATLIESQALIMAQHAPDLILKQLDDSSALLRASGWKAALNLPVDRLTEFASKGLKDTALSVRLAAFDTLLQLKGLPTDSDHVRHEYERYLNEISDRPSGRAIRARYALFSGRPEAAIDDLKVALRKDSAYLPASILLTDLLRSLQRFDEAIAVLNQGLEQQEGEATLLHLRGLTRLQLRQIGPALTDLTAAYRAAPDNLTFGYRLALAFQHTGQHHEAVQIWQELRRDFPGQPLVSQLERMLHQ